MSRREIELSPGRSLILPDSVRSHGYANGGVEVRDPRAATQSLQWTSPNRGMVQEWDADQAFRLGYCANVIAYRCVQIIANAIASVPLVAGRNPRKPADINDNAPIVTLLGPPPGGPAPRLTARKLLRWTVAQQIVTGRRAWEIETAAGSALPIAFWPLVAARLEAVPSQSGNEWFRVFRYGKDSAKVQLAPDAVFYGWDPAGLDFRQAEAPMQAARFDLTLVTEADRYGVSFLRNSAVPAAIISTTPFPDDDTRERFRRQWDAELKGTGNAGRAWLNEVDPGDDGDVSKLVDVKVLGLSAKDARLVEARKVAMMEVAMSLGVPWSKLDASGRTFDNAEVEDRTFWEERLLPLMVDLQDDINMQIAPRLGNDLVWFDLSTVRALAGKRVTPITQTVGAPSLVQAQLMWINEARADYGLPPTPDGDRMMTAEEIGALRGAAGPGDVVARLLELETRSVVGPSTEGQERLDDGTLLNTDIGGRLPVPPDEQHREQDPDAAELRKVRLWRTADAVVRTLEGRWERSWRKLFQRQADATLTRLTGKRGRQALGYGPDGMPLETRDPAGPVDPAHVFDQAHWTAESTALASDLYEDVATAGMARLADAFGVSFDLEADVADFIESRANQLAGPVTQTTYEAIQRELVAGVAEGESIDDLAARIRTVFETATSSRARTIARTEVISAYNGSSALGAASLPADVVAGQEWIATRDSRTRSAHASVDGQVVAIGEAFSVSGSSMAYPGDPSAPSKLTVNCRCTVAFLTPEEFAEVQGRAPRTVEVRTAVAMVRMVDQHTDMLAWRRALEEVAA